MEVTQSAAARLLEGCGLNRPAAVEVLRAGFAGPGRVAGGTEQRAGRVLYDQAAIVALGARPALASRVPERLTGPGAFVLRTHARRDDTSTDVGWSGIDCLASSDEQLAAVSRPGPISLTTAAVALVARRQQGFVPLVVTVSGFVACCAEVTAVRVTPHGSWLELNPAGAWRRTLDETRILSGPGAGLRWLAVDTVSG